MWKRDGHVDSGRKGGSAYRRSDNITDALRKPALRMQRHWQRSTKAPPRRAAAWLPAAADSIVAGLGR